MPERPWWRRGVIYQIAVASFADSDGDGRGDLRGIIDRLDHLRGSTSSLDVDAIWLTPVNVSPMRDFGYDVSDYRAIDPRFGDMATFRELVDACHGRGIRIVVDLVLNHTSNQHPWFVESRSSRDNPKRDWYIWRDGRAPGKPPNRWVSVAEGSAWQLDPATGQYYYHTFLPFQPDLNWRNPAVVDEMLDIAALWLDMGVDGFRLDLINFLYEDVHLRDNPPAVGWRPYFWQRHVYDRSQPESLEATRRLRQLADRYPDKALIGEVCTDAPDDTIGFLGDGSDALHLSFYLDFARRRWNARAFRESVGWLEGRLPPGAWPCYYLNNHDLPRTYTRLGAGKDADARAKVAAAMLLTMRGTPIIYCGEEIGMPSSKVPRRLFRDPLGQMYWPLSSGRDGSRTPMQWSPAEHAGFTTGTPWLPVDPSYPTRNVETEAADPGSLLNWYRSLIKLRATRPALNSGDYHAIDGAPRQVFAFTRQEGEEVVAVLLNFSRRTVSLGPQPEPRNAGPWEVLLSTHRVGGESCDPKGTRLAPYEVLIVRRTHDAAGTMPR